MDPYLEYRGPRQLPPPYRILFDHDPHPKGSIDRVLGESMVRLCPATTVRLYAEFTPTHVAYRPGMRPELERIVRTLGLADRSEEGRVAALVRFASGLAPARSVPLEEMRFGGTEEEILTRGSDWCTDVARVACGLCQVAGLPSRLVVLEDTGQAYSGHMIVETWRSGKWGAVDAIGNVVYRAEDGSPATTWELMSRPELLDAQPVGRPAPGARRGQFSWAAIANYALGPIDSVDYSVGSITPYYRAILALSDQGWPGGLRWLFGEDDSR
ncbi:MAG TPA: transglutaminase domain-containing protein [Thermoplasmata archaeon]|nr:transglutaminase domain-containing protein [Thermoplasmata archaeon]